MERSIYKSRFSARKLEQAQAFWQPICRYLQRHFDPDGVTLDLGAGYCHFINAIASKEKIAVDITGANLKLYAHGDVRCIVGTGADLCDVATSSVDTVFASNVYEHFPSREDVAASFREVRRILKLGGRFIILQPNFAYCVKAYFDFFDHRLTFTDKGMTEGWRFPASESSARSGGSCPRRPKANWPARLGWWQCIYSSPLAWRLLGGQMLLVARKGAD